VQQRGTIRPLGAHVLKTKMLRPEYADKFQCTGPACEDNCCQNWRIKVDDDWHRKLESLPDTPLRASIHDAIEPSADAGPGGFGFIRLNPFGFCPLLTEERRCRIHAELGAEYLCRICRIFPRIPYQIDNFNDHSLSLSCPEAARLVLLADPLLPSDDEPGYFITWNNTTRSFPPLRRFFWPIRHFTMRLVLNRKYPLWQRMFLLGTFSRRLDAIARGDLRRMVPEFIRDFAAAVESGGLNDAMETIHPDPATQFEMVMRLIDLRGRLRLVGPEIMQTIDAFAEGVGCRSGIPLAQQIARYESSYHTVYAPFFARHPQILENYLVNQMFRHVFPFESSLADAAAAPDVAGAYASLATQFALVKGMLIGVAGFYGERFSLDHVIHTVQRISRHFEHSPQYLSDASALVRERKMDDARGLTMLLRN
jgi:lysine-N-methylase